MNYIPFELAKKLQNHIKESDSIEAVAWYNYGELTMFGDDVLLDSYAGEDNRPIAYTFEDVFDWFEDNFKLYSSQDNIILDYCITDGFDTCILKPLGIESRFKNRQEVKEARLRHLIKLINPLD